jgi:hypothetical protein
MLNKRSAENANRFLVRAAGVTAVTLLLAGVLAALQPFGAVQAEADASFQTTWSRTDAPVALGAVSRTWMWGPAPMSQPLPEAYLESPGGTRQVQYFDKSRMEITDPAADPSHPWYVTNGLLVQELVSGRLQTGHQQFEERLPAAINVAGDPDDPSGPTYETMRALLFVPSLTEGSLITWRVNRAAEITVDSSLEQYGVTAAHHVTLPGIDHQVASPFWAFMNSQGLVSAGDQLVVAPLFQDPFYATGLPITEAYWANVKVNNTRKDVLLQCFERRCLTYTPGNPEGWQVEAGNVGQHYYAWRYAEPPSGGTPTATTTATESPTSTASVPPVESPPATATATTPGGVSPTASSTRTPTATRTPSPTRTPTSTATATATPSPTPQDTYETGAASKVPWSGWYWPYPETPLPNMWDEDGPLDKYDRYVEKTTGQNPGALQWELDNQSDGVSWSGHCHAWAAAAIMEPEPRRVTKEGITFTQDEVEGLLTEMYSSPGWKFWGTRCDGCGKQSAEYKDITPAEFDAVVREQMGHLKKNLIMDIDPDTAVWNYPAYEYKRYSTFVNGVEEVTMNITLAVPKVNVPGTVSDVHTYKYTLVPGTDGEWAVGSVTDHPDFVWVVLSRTRLSSQFTNPNVDYDIVKEIAS